MLEHSCGRCVSGIIITFFKVNIHTITPRVLFHNTDKFRAEFILCTVCIITKCLENRISSIICNGKQPSNVWPFIDIGHHTANGYTTFRNCSCPVYLKRKQTDGINAVTVITECFIHTGITHECPHHNAFAFEFIPQIDTPPSVICCNSKSTLADLPSSKVTLCLESQAALY